MRQRTYSSPPLYDSGKNRTPCLAVARDTAQTPWPVEVYLGLKYTASRLLVVCMADITIVHMLALSLRAPSWSGLDGGAFTYSLPDVTPQQSKMHYCLASLLHASLA